MTISVECIRRSLNLKEAVFRGAYSKRRQTHSNSFPDIQGAMPKHRDVPCDPPSSIRAEITGGGLNRMMELPTQALLKYHSANLLYYRLHNNIKSLTFHFICNIFFLIPFLLFPLYHYPSKAHKVSCMFTVLYLSFFPATTPCCFFPHNIAFRRYV